MFPVTIPNKLGVLPVVVGWLDLCNREMWRVVVVGLSGRLRSEMEITTRAKEPDYE
tara:strand:- start:321 stop:488 length:168 start_codon:yes stop_codon:yes gene_type:complete